MIFFSCVVLVMALSACQCSTEAADEDYEGLVIVSEDGRLTIESGAYPGGGTAPDYWSKWTLVKDDGEQVKLHFACTSFKGQVHSLNCSDGSHYYLVECYARASSCDGYEWLEAYRIVGDSVKHVSVIDGGGIEDGTEFEINYSIPNWYFATEGVGYDWILEYDASTGNLYVPLVEEYCILDRYEVWHFNGDRFERLGQRPHKDLCEELGDYNRLIKYFQTKDYIVRVDSLDTGGLRYASWKRPKTMADKPDAVITGGVTVKHPVPSDQLQPCDDYRFKKGKYEYIVSYCETKVKPDGYGEHRDYLLIKKNGNVILKQEKIVPEYD